MVQTDRMRMVLYNPFVSDTSWAVGSFRAEETCKALSSLGVEGIVASPFLRRKRWISDGFQAIPLPSSPIECMKSFLKTVRQGDFDIVQERSFSRGLVRNGYGLAASLDRELPFVMELHNIGTPMSYIRRLPVHVPSLWHSDLILSYANVSKRSLFGADYGKVVPVPNGYSRELLESVMNSHGGLYDLERRTQGRRALGFFGGLTEMKGVGLLLDVADAMKDRNDICFVFAGEGSLAERVYESSRTAGTNVVYLGTLERYSALSCMAQCTMTFAIHNPQQSAVGNPVKVVESIALGVPVIVSADLVMPGTLRSHCITVRDRDCSAIVEAINSVVDANYAARIPDNIDEYSIESISERVIVPAYRRLLDGVNL